MPGTAGGLMVMSVHPTSEVEVDHVITIPVIQMNSSTELPSLLGDSEAAHRAF